MSDRPIRESGTADSDSLQERRGTRLFSFLLINVKVDVGREMTGLVRFRHTCEQQLLPLTGMAATPQPLLLQPLL